MTIAGSEEELGHGGRAEVGLRKIANGISGSRRLARTTVKSASRANHLRLAGGEGVSG